MMEQEQALKKSGEPKKVQVVIIGAGFGGITAAQQFKNTNVDVTVIDKNNYQLFQPLLFQVSTGCLSADEIAYPVRGFFAKQSNVRFRMAEVTGFELADNKILTDTGDIYYDYLIVSAGSMTNFFGLENVEKYAFGLKTLDDSMAVRNHVLKLAEQAAYEPNKDKRRELLTFVCVGGGPTGVEEAGALAELLRDVLSRECKSLGINEISIKLLEATDKILPMLPTELQHEAVRALRNKGVEIKLGAQVADYDGKVLSLRDGGQILTNTVIWAAGVKAVPIAQTLDDRTDPAGRVYVDEFLQTPGYTNAYVIGDMARFMQDDRPLAAIAPVAMQQAVTAANNIMRDIAGRKLQKFVFKDLGFMATIGRGDAVMCKGNMKMSGFFAWAAWMLVHLIRLAGFQSNVTVAWKWICNFFTGSRVNRVIIGDYSSVIKVEKVVRMMPGELPDGMADDKENEASADEQGEEIIIETDTQDDRKPQPDKEKQQEYDQAWQAMQHKLDKMQHTHSDRG